MDVLHPRCAGLDVHKNSVVAAVRLSEPGGVRCEVRRFDTTTPGLLALSDWLAECGRTHAGMEAPGVYWKPVWHVLSDGDLTLVLANAAHVRNVPGRKTDVADAAWLAELLAHGLVRASFPTCRPRPCAPCCAPASNWSASKRATSSGCRRCWRMPTSSSAR